MVFLDQENLKFIRKPKVWPEIVSCMVNFHLVRLQVLANMKFIWRESVKSFCSLELLIFFLFPTITGFTVLSFLSKISYLVLYDHYSISCCVSNYEKGVRHPPPTLYWERGEGAGGGGKGRGGGWGAKEGMKGLRLVKFGGKTHFMWCPNINCTKLMS